MCSHIHPFISISTRPPRPVNQNQGYQSISMVWPPSCPLLVGPLYPRLQPCSSLARSMWNYLLSTNVAVTSELEAFPYTPLSNLKCLLDRCQAPQHASNTIDGSKKATAGHVLPGAIVIGRLICQ